MSTVSISPAAPDRVPGTSPVEGHPAPDDRTIAESPFPIFAALGDPTRLELVSRLHRQGGRSISSLAAGIPLTRQAITKHLQVLEGAGLVTSRRVGRESRYAMRAETVDRARACLDALAARPEGGRNGTAPQTGR